MLVGWEGSAHYATILADCISTADGINMPDGKFYPGDVRYVCRPRCSIIDTLVLELRLGGHLLH